MITERTLKKWRREALRMREQGHKAPGSVSPVMMEFTERLLRMTQELLDQHLLRRNVR